MKENRDATDTNVATIEKDIINAQHFIDSIKTDKEYKEENGWHGYYNKEIVELARILENILSDYKRVLKINEVLLKENEEIRIKNNAIKRESEAYAEHMSRLDNELNLEKEKSKYEWIRQNCLPQELVNKLYIPIQKVKDIIDRIDYDIKKTKEIISKNTNIHASYRKNDYQIVRLRAMNTKSLDIKKRLQELLESEE